MLLAALTLSSAVLLSASPDDFPNELCSRWTQALKEAKHASGSSAPGARDEIAKSFEEVERLAWGKVKVPSAWTEDWNVLGAISPSDHLNYLRQVARRHGGHFECEAFEFPFGKPAAETLVTIAETVQVDALGADETGPWWLACYREPKRNMDQCDLMHLEGKPKLVAAGLPPHSLNAQLVFDGAEVLVLADAEILSVPKTGGAPKSLVKFAGNGRGLTVDGDTLWWLAGPSILRAPRKGGEPTVVFAGPVQEAGSKDLDALAVSKSGICFTAWEGHVYRLTDGVATRVNPSMQFSPVALSGALWFLQGGMLSKLDPATGTVTPTLKAENWIRPVASRGELLGVGSGLWPGRSEILRLKPGATSLDVLVRHVGDADHLAGDAKHVYWYDGLHRQVMSAARP